MTLTVVPRGTWVVIPKVRGTPTSFNFLGEVGGGEESSPLLFPYSATVKLVTVTAEYRQNRPLKTLINSEVTG